VPVCRHVTLQVTKYVMSEEDYASRDNTYRKYKETKLREDPGWTLEKEMCMRRGAE
jgi:tubulin-folding cofactor B